MIISSIISGVGTTQVGYYTPFLIAGTCIVSVGAGLLTILKVNTTTGQWIGYQIVYGFGLGCCFQAPNMAAQTVLPRKEVAIGASLMLFGQTLFGAIFVSVGQNVLDQHLAAGLSRISGISITPEEIVTAGITGLFKIIPPQYHTAVLNAYNSSLRSCFLVALVFACLSIIGSCGMEWRNVKKDGEAKKGESQNPTGGNVSEDRKSLSASSDKEAGEMSKY
jgi:MFS family permease